MSDGIEFIVDIQQRLAGAVAASDALKKLYADAEKADHAVGHAEAAMHKASAASHGAAHAHGEHGHAIWQLGHQYEYAKNGVMEFTEAIGLVLAFEGVEKLVDIVKELGAEILKAAASEERIGKSFGLFFGGDAGRELVEYIDQITNATEFTEGQLKGFAGELGRFGFSAEQIPKALAASMDLAARHVGDKVGGMAEAVSALGTLMTTGRIEARGFKRLGLGAGNAPDLFFAELAKRTGKGVAELKKEMEAGKVPVEDSIEALYKIIAGKRGALGVAALELGKGMEAKITHFREIPEKIFESVEKSPAFGRFASFIGEMTDKLGPEGPLGSKLAAGLGQAFDQIAGKLSKITPEDITGFVNALAAMPGVIADLTKALVQILPYVSQFAGMLAKLSDSGSTISRVYQLGKAVTNPVGFVGGKLKDAYEAPGVKDNYYVKGFETGLMNILTLGHLTDRLGITGQKVGSGLAKGIELATPWVEKATTNMTDAADAAARGPKGADVHSPSRKFMHIGRMSAEGFAVGLEKGMDEAIDMPALSTSALAVIDGISPSAGAGGRGGVSVSAPVTITVNGGDATAQQIADIIAIEVPSAILAAIEQIGLQGGQA